MNAKVSELDRDQWLSDKLDELLPGKFREIEDNKTLAISIIATQGTLDCAYSPFILVSTGAALGWDVSMFFTFYGLLLLKKEVPCEADAKVLTCQMMVDVFSFDESEFTPEVKDCVGAASFLPAAQKSDVSLFC